MLPFVPVTVLVALSIASLPLSGGFFPREWYVGALLVTGLLATTLWGRQGPLPASRWARVALVALVALTLLNFASILWADWKGAAWDSANQLVLLAVAAWIAAIAPWRAAAAGALACLWSVGVAVVLLVTILSAAGSSHPQTYLIDQQFSSPIGYANALAAVAAMAAWPALLLSSRRRVHPLVQATLLAVGTFLILFALLPQSRAAVVLLVVTAVIALLLTPNKVATGLRLAIAGGAVAAAAGPVLDVYRFTVRGHDLHSALNTAAQAMALGAALAFLAGLALAVFERRISPPARLVRLAPQARRAALVLCAAAVVIAAIAFGGRLGSAVSDRWAALKDPTPATDTGAPRITQRISDPRRYDTWRVAWDTFRGAPTAGVGGGNFARVYTLDRRYKKYSLYAHSVELRVLSETGVIGGLLTLAALVALLGGLTVAYLRTRGGARAVVVSSGAVGAYFLAHASVDWLEQFPALVVPVLVLVFGAIGLGARRAAATSQEDPAPSTDEPAPTSHARSAGRWAAIAIGLVALVAALGSLAVPLAARIEVDRAKQEFTYDPAAATRDLKRAADLNPLSSDAQILSGSIALARRDEAGAARQFTAALRVEQRFVPYFQLALIASHHGRPKAARRLIDQALALSPKDAVMLEARDRIKAGKRIDPIAFNKLAANPPLYIRNRLP